MKHEKYFPEVGTPLFIENLYCATRYPYTVQSVSKTEIIIRRATEIFDPTKPVYFDSLPIGIVDNPNGRCVRLHWYPSTGRWQESKYDSAVFGKYDYAPYLD